jgi:hypothetical protein
VSALPHLPTTDNHIKENMPNRIRIAVPIAALALALVAFAAAGCGSDDNGSSSSSSSSTASTASVPSTSGTTSTTSTSSGTASTPDTGSGGASSSGATPSVDDVLKGIHAALSSQGLDDSVAQCVEDALRKSLTQEDVAGATSGRPSSEFRSKIAAAAQACDPNRGQ